MGLHLVAVVAWPEATALGNLLAAAATTGADAPSSNTIATYGPLIVALGGLITALVAALGRRDRRSADQLQGLDARTNTALKGLTEAYDRCDAERARWQKQAEETGSRLEACDQKIEELEEQVVARDRQIAALEAELAKRSRPRTPPRSRPGD
jgi:uncharacterized protein HemX